MAKLMFHIAKTQDLVVNYCQDYPFSFNLPNLALDSAWFQAFVTAAINIGHSVNHLDVKNPLPKYNFVAFTSTTWNSK